MLSRALQEMWRTATGKTGLVLLATMLVLSLYVVLSYPADFGRARWGAPGVWADNPRSVPPVWTNWLTRQRRVPHRVTTLTEPTQESQSGRVRTLLYAVPIQHQADEPPTMLSVSLSEIRFQTRAPIVDATLVRPDGGELVLFRQAVSGPRSGETAPYVRHDEAPLRTVISAQDRAGESVASFYAEQYARQLSPSEVSRQIEALLFGVPGEGTDTVPLRGSYELRVEVLTVDATDRVGSVQVVLGGSVYGAMGTDALGRDLAEGLLFGLPIALLIGIATSTVSTLLGLTLGLTGGYLGGKTDLFIQRAADVVANIPVLPLLIFLVFIGGSQLWLILTVLVAFSWPGLTITIRSMVLQIRTGQEIEAAQALGASPLRVIVRHVLPHTASYSLAQLVFAAPSAILAEAGLSFLGLGDPTIPTWGQILEHGFRTGAVFLGYWWWVIPPGLMIVATAVTFMLLALSLEPVVDPRLRGRRAWHY